MKTETRKVYQCDHCGKWMLSAGAMGYHEKWCKKNPKNRHKCFELCRHLKRTLNMYTRGIEFECLKTGAKMYSFQLEKRNYYAYRQNPQNMERMPLECNKFDEMTFEEQEKRFTYSDDGFGL